MSMNAAPIRRDRLRRFLPSRVHFRAILALLEVTALYLSSQSVGARSFTVDDELKLESIDRAFISPDGSRVVLEYSPPWDTLPDPGLVGGIYDRLGSATLLETLVAAPAKPRPLFKPAKGAGYWVDAFSPDGQRVAISWIQDRTQKAGVFDFETRTLREFPFVPYISVFQLRPVWISNDELIYSVMVDGRVSPRYFDRIAIADRLMSMWNRSWNGREPAVTVLCSADCRPAHTEPQSRGALIRVDAQTGSIRHLANGAFINLSVSPDRKFLAAIQVSEFVQPQPDELTPFIENRRADVVVFELNGDHPEVRICDDCNAAVGTLQWSTSSDALVVFARARDELWENGRFYRYDVLSGNTTRIDHIGLDLVSEHERWIVHRPEASVPMRDGLVVFARARETRDAAPYFSMPKGGWSQHRPRADWFLVGRDGQTLNLTRAFKNVSPRLLGASNEAIFVLADGGVWRLSARQRPRRLTNSSDGALEYVTLREGATSRFDLSLYERQPWAHSYALLREVGHQRALVIVNLRTGAVTHVRSPSPEAAVMAVSSQSGSAVFYSAGRHRTTVSLARRDSPIVPLVAINTHLDNVEPATRKSISYLINGEVLTGCALLPAGWSAGRRYPTIVDLYPNRTPDCSAPRRLRPTAELIASWGYIYFEPQTPRHLIRTSEGPVHGITRVMLTAIDQLIAQGFADPDRLGLFGESQGGFVGPWVLTETHRFKAAVAVNGVSDHGSLYGELPVPRAVLPEEWFSVGAATRYEYDASDFYLGAPPWVDPEAYVRTSPYYQAGKIDTPLLLIHSDLDFFPIQQYELLFTALYRQHKDAQFVRYWGEEHSLRSPANVRDRWQRIKDWYGQRLLSPRSSEIDSRVQPSPQAHSPQGPVPP